MRRACVVLAALGVLGLAGCERSDNPLVSATDGQFSRLIAPNNAFSPSCAAALYAPDTFVEQYNALKFSPQARISEVSEQQKASCVVDLQKRARDLGLSQGVTREHLDDERVRRRYLAATKR
jgi:hypothetical protein